MPSSALEEDVIEVSDGTVWFVDDDRAMVNATTQWLQLSGLKVRSFADPLALLRSVKPQLNIIVVSDIRMPEMNGIQLMQQVLKIDSAIPIILVTGHGDVPLAVSAMKKGAYEFLTKPFSPEDLLRHCVNALLARTRSLQIVEKEQTEKKKEAVELLPVLNRENGLTDQIEEYEKALIQNALQKHKGKIALVLEELDLPRRTLNAKMQKYGISRKTLS